MCARKGERKRNRIILGKIIAMESGTRIQSEYPQNKIVTA